MPIEPFEITTVYSDGRIEKRVATPEEILSREEVERLFKLEEIERENNRIKLENLQVSIKSKLVKLGFSEEEVSLIVR